MSMASENTETLRHLYPPIEPFGSGRLAVGDGHELHFEECGNPRGKPAVFLHGGPGGGIRPHYRQYFDPEAWRVVLFDQRGCGRSTPWASLEANTTWHLVDDMEALRRHLGISSWLVFGGSWGSALALAYAQTHPERVGELVLYGIFTLRRSELLWLYQDGASHIFPEAWEDFVTPVPETGRGDLMGSYLELLMSGDSDVERVAARAWSVWEGSILSLYPDRRREKRFASDDFARAFARIECHYFVNRGFFPRDGHLISNIDRCRHIPAVIVQGRYDICTPARTAWDLHRAWPEADFRLVPDTGHTALEPGNVHELVGATDGFR